MIWSDDAIALLQRFRGDAVAVTTMAPLRLWGAVSTRRDLDLEVADASGKVVDVGLGLALARPDRRTLVLDSDGGLLTNLSALVTVGEQAPRNLAHVLFQDGGQPEEGGASLPGAWRMDFARMARDAGYTRVETFDSIEDFALEAPVLLSADGPVFIALRVRHRLPLPPRPDRPPARVIRDLRAALTTASGR